MIQDLIVNEVKAIIDFDLWNEALEQEARGVAQMERIADNYAEIIEFLDDLESDDEVDDWEDDDDVLG